MDEDQSTGEVPSFHGLSNIEMNATKAYERLRITDIRIPDHLIISNFVYYVWSWGYGLILDCQLSSWTISFDRSPASPWKRTK